MLRVLIWHVSDDTSFKDRALKILEQQHDGLEVVGTVKGTDFSKVDGVGDYEILVVGAKQIGMSKVTQDATQLRLPEEKLLGDWIVCIPGFTLKKYRQLQRSRLSIISKNCFGGLISHTLGLPFLSPFVNLSVRDEQECVLLFQHFYHYMKKDLTLKGTEFEHVLKFNYPIFAFNGAKFGDVNLHMNHYSDFDEALAKWNKRKEKINWYNLFVVMFTGSEEILEQFDALPYGKKVCFVPFKSDLDSAWYLNRGKLRNLPLWDVVNHFGSGNPFFLRPVRHAPLRQENAAD